MKYLFCFCRYKHGVIKDLVSPVLLRSVRSEIQKLSFTPKETDLYRIDQSGDLVNLDGLEDSSLKLLPSLLVLRDALYSSKFRNYLSQITQAGPLSGKKTDMAVNVYTPGCHLLCHDDVIGSRRVSYILYLTDPDKPWKEEWGGALRLYPTSHPIAKDQSKPIAEDQPKPIAEDLLNPTAKDQSKPVSEDRSNPVAGNQMDPTAEDQLNPVAEIHPKPIAEDQSSTKVEDQSYTIAKDQSLKVTLPDPTVSIPPAFNQLSFFAVQPGESFHDVEEVFASDDKAEDEARVRIAISGWYHIPQEAEEGYIEGLDLETKLTEKSSLTQLQGKGDAYDRPSTTKTQPIYVDTSFGSSTDHDEKKPLAIDPSFSEDEWDFLLRYINPGYLIPDTLESVAAIFTENYALTLSSFLSPKFSSSLRDYIVIQESQVLPATSTEIERTTPWTVARPPHKHRFLFLQGGGKKNIKDQSPLQDLLENLLPSLPFHKWLQLATGQVISSHNLLARRFRRGKDYTIATRYDEEDPQLEITLAITPTSGWEAEGPATDQTVKHKEHTHQAREHIGSDQQHTTVDDGAHGVDKKSQTGGEKKSKRDDNEPTGRDVGGGKKRERDQSESTGGDVGGYVAYLVDGEEDSKDFEDAAPTDGQAKRPRSDPAVYQRANEEDEDFILAHMPAAWNRLDVVLRDTGVMRFVKYVSQKAKGDRWDVCGEFSVVPSKDEEEEDEEVTQESQADGGNVPNATFLEDTDETELKSESETSDDY